jgi:hypothetical protein
MRREVGQTEAIHIAKSILHNLLSYPPERRAAQWDEDLSFLAEALLEVRCGDYDRFLRQRAKLSESRFKGAPDAVAAATSYGSRK